MLQRLCVPKQVQNMFKSCTSVACSSLTRGEFEILQANQKPQLIYRKYQLAYLSIIINLRKYLKNKYGFKGKEEHVRKY